MSSFLSWLRFFGQMLHASPGWREKERVKKKKWKSRWKDGGHGAWGLKISYGGEFVSKDISSDGKRWDENLNGITCDWLALSLKIKMWNCGNGKPCAIFIILCAPWYSKKKRKRKQEITPLFGVRNGNTSRIERKHILFDKSICVWWNTFNISVVYACSDTLQQGLTDWLECQQHFITLKHNIAISRHFRIHLL